MNGMNVCMYGMYVWNICMYVIWLWNVCIEYVYGNVLAQLK